MLLDSPLLLSRHDLCAAVPATLDPFYRGLNINAWR